MTLRDEELIGAVRYAARNGYGLKVESKSELRTVEAISKALEVDVRFLVFNPVTEAYDPVARGEK